MSDHADFRLALAEMLTGRFTWYASLAPHTRNEFLDAVAALCHATRSTIREQAAQAERETERQKRLQPLELPCFACGLPALRMNGRWFGSQAVYEAWAKHYGIIDDDDEQIGRLRSELLEYADGEDGAHSRCALIAATRAARLAGGHSPYAVHLPESTHGR